MPRKIAQALWRLYVYIIFASVCLFAVQAYFVWSSIIKEARDELTYANRMTSSSMLSLLSRNEAVFEVTGERLVELGINEKNQQALALIDDLLSDNSELIGITILTPKGEIVLSSSNLGFKSLKNLLKIRKSDNSYNRALFSDVLVLGKPYFYPRLNQSIMPIYYPIKNSNNDTVLILMSGLKIHGKNGLWQDETTIEEIRVSIISHDYYYLFASFLNNSKPQVLYSKQINSDYTTYFSKELKKQTGFTLDDFIQGKQGVVTTRYQGPTGVELIGAFSYDPKYLYFTFTTKQTHGLYGKLYMPLVWVLVFIVGFNAILFLLFRQLSQSEKESKKKLEYLAQHDQLTGLPNLRYLNNHFTQWKKHNGNSFSVLFMDLDNFKNSNDLHGHAIGDKILREVATRIKSFFKNCLCIRQGGDEFIVIVSKAFTSDIESEVSQFLNSLRKTIKVQNLEFSIRASIGVASSPADGLEIDSLLRKADIAMYEAKRLKSGVYLFSRKLDMDNSRASMIGKELNSAIAREEMSLVYQPQIDSQTKRVIGVEALLRWNNQMLGEVSPREFIPIAESSGIILDIGRFVFETALSEFYDICNKQTKDKHIPDSDKIRLSINLSVRQLVDPGFIDFLFSLVGQFDCYKSRLMLEITETMTIDRVDEVRTILEKIQISGIDISLDDFGTGYSSLSHLSVLPINEIKIDKSFIDGLLENQQDITFIKSILNLGKSLKVQVLAEGVETKDQVDILMKHGCRYFQGFYFSKPLSIAEIDNFLEQRT